ncbi:MAG: GNAT family N-acetyltransferase [Planctomycetia bacterium]|nr:GNAT family N-acetyltransferase [Planctomycetia bacterium]
MIETRTYEGGPDELAAFASRVWHGTYAGKMMLPLWDARYFDWQLLSDRPGGRDFLVTAYDGTKLVGSLLGEKFRFRLHDREFDATMGSWLTVDPEYRRQGVGKLLFEEQQRRHQAHDAKFNLGYGYTGSRLSMGPKFWATFPANTVVLGHVGFWARMLDPATVSQWDLSRRDRIGSRILGLFQNHHPQPRDPAAYRPYRPDDLPGCLELSHRLLDRVDLGYVWSGERLAHQLSWGDMPRTLVAERGGRVAGFVNWYRLNFLGRFPIPAAMVDLMAFGSLSLYESKELLRAALDRMKAEGVKLALALRIASYPFWPLAQTGWIAIPREFSLICVRMDPTFSLDGARRMHLHWR